MAGEKSRCQVVLRKLSVHLADIFVALANLCFTIQLSQFIVSKLKAPFSQTLRNSIFEQAYALFSVNLLSYYCPVKIQRPVWNSII